MHDSTQTQYNFTGQPENVAGRIYKVLPGDHQHYYSRTILLYFSGATSFQDLQTFDKTIYPTYQGTCFQRGIISDNADW